MDKKKTTNHKLQVKGLLEREETYKLQIKSNFKMVIGRTAMFLISFFTTFLATAQDTTAKKEAVDMATGMRSNGKIYVVVAVLCIILVGIFIYLINLDKKIGRLEKDTNSNH